MNELYYKWKPLEGGVKKLTICAIQKKNFYSKYEKWLRKDANLTNSPCNYLRSCLSFGLKDTTPATHKVLEKRATKREKFIRCKF